MDKDAKHPLDWLSGEAAAEPSRPCEVDQTAVSSVDLLDAYSKAVIAVVEAVGPAVVSISVGQETSRSEFEPMGAGSGFAITPDGYLLTNSHMVADAKKIETTFMDGRRLEATLIGMDASTDLAVIRVNASALPYAELGESSGLRTGDLVVAINQNEVTSVDDMFRILAEWPVGQRLILTVIRGKERIEMSIAPIEAT